jgi:phosphoserine phosphatase
MVDQAWGDIVDGEEKRRTLLQTCEQLGIAPGQAIAVGDGANDLPMMGVAGLSVAYHAKPPCGPRPRCRSNRAAWTACWNCCAESSEPPA